MRIESFIGLRFLMSPRRDRAISIITWISGLGITFGVTALIVTISVMNGFRENLFLAVTGATPHLRVLAEQGSLDDPARQRLQSTLSALPGVQAVAPYLSGQAFLSLEGVYRPMILRGIDAQLEPRVTEVARFVGTDAEAPASPQAALARGERLLAQVALPPPEGKRPGIVLGGSLARSLGLVIGDDVRIISTSLRQTPIGPVPLMKTVRLVGFFETGLGGNDDVLGFVDWRLAQALFRDQARLGLEARVSGAEGLDSDAWRAALPGYQVLTWADDNKNVFQVMRLEKLGLFLILTLILVVSFFNIISSLVMLVLEKRRGVGILKALGATDGQVQRVFFTQGVGIGLLGTVLGLAAGLLICWVLATFDLVHLPRGVFPASNRFPVDVQVTDLLAIAGASFLICAVVTLYPALLAARLKPVQTLRDE